MLPGHKLGAQAIEIKLRKRIFRAGQIAERALQHRARANRVVARLVMKGNRQLHQPLKMPAAWLAVSRLAPNVFKHLMSVEEMSAIEQIKTASQSFSVDN